MLREPSDLREILDYEILQRRLSGYAAEGLDEISARVAQAELSVDECSIVFAELDALGLERNWLYEEPSDLPRIRDLSRGVGKRPTAFTEGQLFDSVYGGWLGRCIGCTMGKPVENGPHWTVQQIREYLQLSSAYPLRDYFPVLEPMPKRFVFRDNWIETTRGRVISVSRDDDIDYTILGLHLLETHGFAFSVDDVAGEWLAHLPFKQTFTAERVVYRHLVNGIAPAEAASLFNPYREWIGALIRADVYGYTSPGDPWRAAELAYRDARLTHRANGMYGAMWAAALVSLAFVSESAAEAVELSLGVLPSTSRLHEAIETMLRTHSGGSTWESAIDAARRAYDSYDWVHTVNNAAVIAAGLLWGDGDFATTVGLTVQGGWDTDSNGATAGSVAGILAGASRLPDYLVGPLHDTVRSSVFGFDGSRITDLARRTCALVPDPVAGRRER